ncbi:hypothetical protein FIBSPDRAFT_855567 [Athelia psychrophila]|uniref:Uncharacterized protein n=1 Tax=Athelia psychrophila TaxID=1759441 RepID=A0A166P2I6_9AGAM|nr:hypothetical protein FIBSPDRAFT_855567 [Fibularhizoctonia sp. CBS 109695]
MCGPGQGLKPGLGPGLAGLGFDKFLAQPVTQAWAGPGQAWAEPGLQWCSGK